MNKSGWLDAAEVFDSWRVFPRVLVAAFAFFVYQEFRSLTNWYMAIPHSDANLLAVQSAFVFGILGVLTTLAGYIFKVYTDGGRDWEEDRQARGETVTAVASVTK